MNSRGSTQNIPSSWLSSSICSEALKRSTRRSRALTVQRLRVSTAVCSGWSLLRAVFKASARPIRRLPRECSCQTGRTASDGLAAAADFDRASFAPVAFDRRLSAEWGLVQEEGRAMRE
jgi:hypothetical protein